MNDLEKVFNKRIEKLEANLTDYSHIQEIHRYTNEQRLWLNRLDARVVKLENDKEMGSKKTEIKYLSIHRNPGGSFYCEYFRDDEAVVIREGSKRSDYYKTVPVIIEID